MYVHVRCSNSIVQAAQNCQQIYEVSYSPAVGTRNPRDFCIETDAKSVREVAIIAPANIDLANLCALRDALRQGSGRLLPVERNVTCLGEVIASTAGNEAKRAWPGGTLHAVDRFVDAAITADDNDLARPTPHMSGYLIFEVAHGSALSDVQCDTVCLEQPPDPLKTPPGPATPGCRVDEK